MPKVTFFDATPGGRDVVRKFMSADLKKRPEVKDQLVDQIALLGNGHTPTLRERGVIEHVEEKIFSFKFKAKVKGNIWVRMLIAFWPDDNAIVILLPLLKKQNKLDRDDIDQAKRNLQILEKRA